MQFTKTKADAVIKSFQAQPLRGNVDLAQLYAAVRTLHSFSESRKAEVCAIIGKSFNSLSLSSTEALYQLSFFNKEYECDSIKKLSSDVTSVLKSFTAGDNIKETFYAVLLS